jgi:coenzyme PQQ biosynthesis protein PqqD
VGKDDPVTRTPFRLFTSADHPEGLERPRQQDGVLAQEAQGQTVLLRMDDGGYYALDEVGARIWQLCDGERTLGEITDVLCHEFDAPRETISGDVREFVAELQQEDLLH